MVKQRHTSVRPAVEGLESRIVPYALCGSSWANLKVTYSFMPDGTYMSSGYASALFATLDAVASREVWQGEIDRAMQTWANASGLTLTRVSDDGSPEGIAGPAQGDSRFGDIRIGARPMDALGYTWYPSTTTLGGDMELTTSHTFQIGSVYDLYSVVLHEAGHALGLAHSDVSGAVMQVAAYAIFSGLQPDDVAGIQALYGPDSGTPLPPPPSGLPADRFEPNETIGTAHNFGTVTGLSQTGLTVHTSTDTDFFAFTPRKGGTYTISITFAQASGNLDLAVYNAQGNLLASANSTTDNESLTLSLSGGQQYYVKVFSPVGDMNGYDLTVAKPATGGSTGGGKGAKLVARSGPGDYLFITEPEFAELPNRGPDFPGGQGLPQASERLALRRSLGLQPLRLVKGFRVLLDPAPGPVITGTEPGSRTPSDQNEGLAG